jgi:hypothetical protein
MTWIVRILNKLWRPTRRVELFTYIPLGIWKTSKFKLEWLGTFRGWHIVWLLMTLDYAPSLRNPGWRWQRQLHFRPTKWASFEPQEMTYHE